MTRALLVLLLVATNAFWLIRRIADSPDAGGPPPELAALEAREEGLRKEIDTLLARAPSTPPSAPARQQARPPSAPARPKDDWADVLRRTPEPQRPAMRASLIRGAFDGGEPLLALDAISRAEVPEDAAFRGDVARCLDSEDESVRLRALFALRRLPPDEAETARLLELSRDASGEVRAMAGASLVAHVAGPRGSEAAAAVVRLVRESGRVALSTVSWGLWESCPRYPPELEEALLAAEGEVRSEVFIQAFRHMDPKSERVVDALLKAISGTGGHRFTHSLRAGVPPHLEGRIAEVALKLIRTRTQVTPGVVDLLALHGSAEDADTLERMLADGLIGGGWEKSVERACAAIRKRVAGG